MFKLSNNGQTTKAKTAYRLFSKVELSCNSTIYWNDTPIVQWGILGDTCLFLGRYIPTRELKPALRLMLDARRLRGQLPFPLEIII